LGPHLGPHSFLPQFEVMTCPIKKVKKKGFFLVLKLRGPKWGPKHVSEKKCHDSILSKKIFGAPFGAPRIQNLEKSGFFGFFGALLGMWGAVGAPNGAPGT